jgi:two-component system, NarL family, sensor histidine kinase UhpB
VTSKPTRTGGTNAPSTPMAQRIVERLGGESDDALVVARYGLGRSRSRNAKLAREYTAALRRYLQRGGEADLGRANELGRHGLKEGLGVLDMVALYHQSLVQARRGRRADLNGDTLERAGLFFSESMSPFAMTQRAVGEANAALHRMNEVLEEEVKRIAHALHDEAAQLLAAVHLSLDQLEHELCRESKGRLQEVKGLLNDVDYQLRHLSHDLRPTLLDDLGLVPALEFLSEGVAKRTGLRVAHRATYAGRLPAAVETALYRVVQEALNNVSKHARATSVSIYLHDVRKAVKCSITDNGVGFDVPAVMNNPRGQGLGLRGIREKLQPLGGVVEIESNPGQGTRLLIREV